MFKDIQRTRDILEIYKGIAQIVAIILAGIWSYFLFGQKEAPSLEPRADASSGISWEAGSTPNTCRAIFSVIFKNTGNSSYDITKVRLRGWMFDKTSDSSKTAAFLDLDEIQKDDENKIFDEEYLPKSDQKGIKALIPFLDRYPPEATYNNSYEWEIKNFNGKWVCFKIEFFKNNQNDQPKWVTASWDRICNVVSSQK